MKTIALAVVTAATTLGGCILPKVSGTPMIAPDTIYSAPAVTLTEKGAFLRKGNKPAFCRGEVAGMYGTRPQYVKTNPPVTRADGSTTIDGTADKGGERIKKFQCRYNAKGVFIGARAL